MWSTVLERIFAFSHATASFGANLFVQSTILTILGLIAARYFRKRGAPVQSTILRVALAAIILCPFVSFCLEMAGVNGLAINLPGANVSPQMTDRIAQELEPVGPQTAGFSPATDARIPESPRPFPEFSSVEAIAEDEETAAALPEVRPRHLTVSLSPYHGYTAITALWIMISGGLLIRLCVAHLQVARARRLATEASSAVREACRVMAREMGTRSASVLISRRVRSPCLFGFRHPTILLPPADAVVSREVILHELTHLAGHDCLWNLVGSVTRAVIFFQPLVWILTRRIEDTSDEIADDSVVHQGSDRRTYARQLVHIAESFRPASSETLAGMGVVSFQSSLGRRVQRILDTGRTLSLRTGTRVATAIAVLGLVATLACGLIGTGRRGAVPQVDEVAGKTEESNALDEQYSWSSTGAVVDPCGKPMPPGIPSRAWYVLRDPNAGPLLLGLAQRLGKLVELRERRKSLWEGVGGGNSVELDITVEGDTTGEIFVGFFADAAWKHYPLQIRSFPGPGKYPVTNLPPGEFEVGAMMGSLPEPDALGVHHSWPEPIEIKPGEIPVVPVLLSPEFQRNAAGGSREVAEGHAGLWGQMDEDNLLQGQVTGPDGEPIPYCVIQIREHNPGTRAIAAPDTGTDEQGRYYFDQIRWPYKVSVGWREPLPTLFGYRYQFLIHRIVFEGPNTVSFRFEEFPSGTATLTGKAVDRNGHPVKRFRLEVRRGFGVKDPSPDYERELGIRVPFFTSDGAFSLEELPPGPFEIRARWQTGTGNRPAAEPVEVLLENGVVTGATVVFPQRTLYGRVLFEDGQPAVLDPPPWPGATTSIVSWSGPPIGSADIVAPLDQHGYFTLYLEDNQLEQIESGERELRISCPLPGEQGRSRTVGMFPVKLLSTDREQAETLRVPRPGSGPPARTIHFPEDRCMGELRMRDHGTDESPEVLGEARGTVAIPEGKDVILLMEAPLYIGTKKIDSQEVFADLSPLTELRPDDLQTLCIRGPELTDNELVHFRSLTGLRNLEFAGSIITDQGLLQLQPLAGLRGLTLFRCERITDRGIANLKHLDSLRSLTLSDMKEVTGEALEGLRSLEQLGLVNCPNLTAEGLAGLERSGSLQELRLGHNDLGNEKITPIRLPKSLKRLDLREAAVPDETLACVENLESLEELDLGHSGINGAALVHLKDLKSLKRLNLEYTDTDDSSLSYLSELASLEFLGLEGTPTAGEGLSHLGKLTSLKEITLDYRVTDAGMQYLGKLPSLEKLDLGPHITDAGLAHLKGLIALQRLNLNRSQVTDAGLAYLKEMASLAFKYAGLAYLKEMASLEDLRLMGKPITDKGLADVSHLTSLKALRLRDTQITNAGLVHLKKLPSLETLGLERTQVSDEGLVHLGRLPSLTKLDLLGTPITDAGLAHLGNLSSLEFLDLQRTQVTGEGLRHLDGLKSLKTLLLYNTQLTNENLKYLRNLTSLERLSLGNAGITDAGLEDLKALGFLRSLELYDTKLSKEGIRELREVLPDCIVDAAAFSLFRPPKPKQKDSGNQEKPSEQNGDAETKPQE